MASSRNNGPLNGGNGLPADPRVLKFLGQLVKGQADLRSDLNRFQERIAKEQADLRRDLKRFQEQHAKEFRMLFKIGMDSHKDIQVLKKKVGAIESDVADLTGRMARVEKRLDGNGMPRSGSNGH